jgi:hypothetical protein
MKSFLARWWPVLILAAVVVALVVYVNHLRGRASNAEADRDRVSIEAAGGNAAHEVSAKALRDEAARLAGTNALLQAEVDRLKAALPGAKPAGTLSGGTGTVPAQGTPSPNAPVVAPPNTTPGATPCPEVAPAMRVCLLASGDGVEIRVSAVALRGDSGAIGIAGVAQAWRAGASPTLLAEGPLKLDVKIDGHAKSPGWAAGVIAAGSRGGYWIGPLLSPPPVEVWGLEGSLLVGAGVGGGGEWGGVVAGLVRWQR